METKDGFSFKRVKISKDRISLPSEKAINNTSNRSNFEGSQQTIADDAFVFKTVRKNQTITSGKRDKSTTKRKSTGSRKLKPFKTTQSKKTTNKKPTNKKSTNKKPTNKGMVNKKLLNESSSINNEEMNNILCSSTNNEEMNNILCSTNSFEETLKLEIPNINKIKSTELYTVSDGTVEGLLIQCFKFLNVETVKYAQTVCEAVIGGKYAQPDLDTEIEKVQEEMEEVDREIEKWNEIYHECILKNVVDCTMSNKPLIQSFNDNENIKKEMIEREKNLNLLEERLMFRVDQLQVRGEILVKNIFESDDKPEVDPVFLLRAMTKLV